jgi:hypothetical protein
MEKELGKEIDILEVEDTLIKHFESLFEVEAC